MKAQDIVDRLSAIIPRYTDGFSSSVSIDSIVPTGTTALVTTSSPHGLSNGNNVSIINAEAPVEIDTSSFLRTGSQAKFSTLQDHDLTLSQRDIASGGKEITISGANESEFNGTFQLISVLNRREVIIAVDGSGSTTISGSPLIDDANGGVFNGLFPVSNVTTNTFEYELPVSYSIPATGNATVSTSIRILSVLDIQQYLIDVYTKQAIGDDHLVVQLGDVSQSKKRNEETDASDSTVGEYSFTPVLIQTFSIYIVQNVTNMLSASPARDKVESVYIPAIFKAVLREKFATGLTYSQYRATFTGHGIYAFDDSAGKNKAVYVHEVSFEQLAAVDKIADTAQPVSNVAMRDIEYTLPS
jgi:hypothetical protein